MKFRVCSTLISPKDVKVSSSSGGYYNVTPPSMFNDGVCECKGYVFSKKGDPCKHIKLIDSMRCKWHTADIETEITACPLCGEEAVIYETEPEWEDGNS